MERKLDGVRSVRIETEAWLAPDLDLLAVDRRVHAAEDAPGVRRVLFDVDGTGPRAERARAEAKLRYQRLNPSFNEASRAAWFGPLLAAHRALFPTHKPLVRADYEHALDVWQWTLRLDPRASACVQVAALFHDVERLASEADVRVEQHATHYERYKERHAAAGARLMRDACASLVPPEVLVRAASLVERHERTEADPEVRLLNDADALSFFALNSPGFVRYFDASHSAKKVRYTLRRMSPRARVWLDQVRLEAHVETLVEAAAHEEAASNAQEA